MITNTTFTVLVCVFIHILINYVNNMILEVGILTSYTIYSGCHENLSLSY